MSASLVLEHAPESLRDAAGDLADPALVVVELVLGRAVLAARARRLRTRLEPLALSDRTPLARQLAGLRVDHTHHHPGGRRPGAGGRTLSPARLVEFGPRRSGEAPPRRVAAEGVRRVVAEPEAGHQGRRI